MLFFHLQEDHPKGATLNALGFYLLVSLFFVIGTMVELAIVVMIKRTQRYRRCQTTSRNGKKGSRKNTEGPNVSLTQKSTSVESLRNACLYYSNNDMEDEQMSRTQNRSRSITDTVDFAALIIFLLSFLVFNFFYSLKYM